MNPSRAAATHQEVQVRVNIHPEAESSSIAVPGCRELPQRWQFGDFPTANPSVQQMLLSTENYSQRLILAGKM